MRGIASAVAIAVWNLVAVASRTVTVTTNNDKAGYSLTAGSYSIRVQNTQRAVITISEGTSSNTATITSVTMGRAILVHLGESLNGSGVDTVIELANSLARQALTAATTVTATRGAATTGTDTYASFDVPEVV